VAKERPVSEDLNKKLRFYLLLNVMLVIMALFLFDLMGILNIRRIFLPVVSSLPLVGKLAIENVEDPLLLNREEKKKEEYSLSVWEDKLKEREKTIAAKEAELKSKEESLASEREEIQLMVAEFEKSKNEYANYKKNVIQQAIYIESMPPKEAVARLKEMDDMIVIDIFREMERRAQSEGRNSIVPYLLSLLEPKRASVIQKKMMLQEEN